MKTGCSLLFFLFFTSNIMAQKEKAIGKIIYERLTRKNVEYIEMWFSGKAYKYSLRIRPDQFLVVKKDYASVEDSLEVVRKNAQIKQMFTEGPPPQIWYGSLAENVVLNKVELNNESVITADTLQLINWQILEDTMTINNMSCQKAVGKTLDGRKLFVWFAPSIPVSVAPYSLRGLPGLILEVGMEDHSVHWKLIELQWPLKEDVYWSIPDKKSIVSKEERKKLTDKHNAAVWELIEYYKKLEKEKAKKN